MGRPGSADCARVCRVRCGVVGRSPSALAGRADDRAQPARPAAAKPGGAVVARADRAARVARPSASDGRCSRYERAGPPLRAARSWPRPARRRRLVRAPSAEPAGRGAVRAAVRGGTVDRALPPGAEALLGGRVLGPAAPRPARLGDGGAEQSDADAPPGAVVDGGRRWPVVLVWRPAGRARLCAGACHARVEPDRVAWRVPRIARRARLAGLVRLALPAFPSVHRGERLFARLLGGRVSSCVRRGCRDARLAGGPPGSAGPQPGRHRVGNRLLGVRVSRIDACGLARRCDADAPRLGVPTRERAHRSPLRPPRPVDSAGLVPWGCPVSGTWTRCGGAPWVARTSSRCRGRPLRRARAARVCRDRVERLVGLPGWPLAA